MSRTNTRRLIAATLCLSLLTISLCHAETNNIAKGEKIFSAKCAMCHALESNKVGPLTRGVYGRQAGTVDKYHYSEGLKGLNVVWNDATLDQWLTDPPAVAKGTKMLFRLKAAEDREAVIAYLKTLSVAPHK